MLAKITSELGKPAGLVVLSREEALERFAAESPGLIPGHRAEDGRQAGADGDPHPGRAARPRPRALEQAFGPRRGAGCTAARVSKTRPRSRSSARPSRSRPRPPSTSTSTTAASSAASRPLAEELCRRLRARELEGRTIGIKVRLDDWTNVTRSHTVETPTNDPDRGHRRRPRPAPRLRPATPGAPARRPPRRLRRQRGKRSRTTLPGASCSSARGLSRSQPLRRRAWSVCEDCCRER